MAKAAEGRNVAEVTFGGLPAVHLCSRDVG